MLDQASADIIKKDGYFDYQILIKFLAEVILALLHPNIFLHG
jgi:hypothetical protein